MEKEFTTVSSIVANNIAYIDVWHIIDGRWYHLRQETSFDRKKKKYFTDGVLQTEVNLNEDGTMYYETVNQEQEQA